MDIDEKQALEASIANWAAAYEKLANEVERLRDKCDTQAMILRRLTPDRYPGYFITGELGKKDQNGLPEKLLIVPTYGVDWAMIYERTNKASGPEW